MNKSKIFRGFILLCLIAFVYAIFNYSGTAEEREAKVKEKEKFTNFAQHCAELIVENYGNIVKSTESYSLGYITYYFDKAHCKIGESAEVKGHCKYECKDY